MGSILSHMSIKVRYSVHTVRVKLSTPFQSSTSSWVCIASCTTFRTRVYRMRTRRRRLSIFPKLRMNAKKPKSLETTNKPLRKPSESLIVPRRKECLRHDCHRKNRVTTRLGVSRIGKPKKNEYEAQRRSNESRWWRGGGGLLKLEPWPRYVPVHVRLITRPSSRDIETTFI